MTHNRENSLSPLGLNKWSWEFIFHDLVNELSIFNLNPYPVPPKFLYKQAKTNLQKKSSQVSISTWACSFSKIKQARIACINGGNSLSVFNLVIHPLNTFDLPFFGADFVTLPNGHLLALDLQPALKSDQKHTEKAWSRLTPIHDRWQPLLPFGGRIPKEAEPFFSPGFLWTRLPLGPESENTISGIIRSAFLEYIALYIDLIKESSPVSEDRSKQLLEGQKSYLHYRATKDPARGMLTRIFGKEWTEEYITEVLFDF